MPTDDKGFLIKNRGESRSDAAVIALVHQLARLKSFGFGGDMSGIALSDIDAWKILGAGHPQMKHLDVVKFICDLDEAYNDIVAVERMINK